MHQGIGRGTRVVGSNLDENCVTIQRHNGPRRCKREQLEVSHSHQRTTSPACDLCSHMSKLSSAECQKCPVASPATRRGHQPVAPARRA